MEGRIDDVQLSEKYDNSDARMSLAFVSRYPRCKTRELTAGEKEGEKKKSDERSRRGKRLR